LLAEAGSPPACYRYRTCVLVGPWRSQWDAAQGDAVRARQAYFDDVDGFSWSVTGRIEIGCPIDEDEIVPGRTSH
jgi:hypothetical protein